VTDGETNASLPRDVEPETITPERAAELLAERRSKGPATPRTRKGTTAPKSTGARGSTASDSTQQ
jgi:DNA topoisomerase-1